MSISDIHLFTEIE